MSASIEDRVNRVANGLIDDDEPTLRDRDILGLKYEVTESGNVTEVRATLTVGGPHIEVECLRGVVSGQWSGETFRRGIESEEVHDYGKMLADRMEARID
jgi:hypothetical protein